MRSSSGSVRAGASARNHSSGVFDFIHALQTVLLGASNGAVVEFIVPEQGQYMIVDHEFADAAKGAVGKIIAGPRVGVTSDARPADALPPMTH